MELDSVEGLWLGEATGGGFADLQRMTETDRY